MKVTKEIKDYVESRVSILSSSVREAFREFLKQEELNLSPIRSAIMQDMRAALETIISEAYEKYDLDLSRTYIKCHALNYVDSLSIEFVHPYRDIAFNNESALINRILCNISLQPTIDMAGIDSIIEDTLYHSEEFYAKYPTITWSASDKFKVSFSDSVVSSEIIRDLTEDAVNRDIEDCPFGGDISDDCADCAYNEDYHYSDGECKEREVK